MNKLVEFSQCFERVVKHGNGEKVIPRTSFDYGEKNCNVESSGIPYKTQQMYAALILKYIFEDKTGVVSLDNT